MTPSPNPQNRPYLPNTTQIRNLTSLRLQADLLEESLSSVRGDIARLRLEDHDEGWEEERLGERERERQRYVRIRLDYLQDLVLQKLWVEVALGVEGVGDRYGCDLDCDYERGVGEGEDEGGSGDTVVEQVWQGRRGQLRHGGQRLRGHLLALPPSRTGSPADPCKVTGVAPRPQRSPLSNADETSWSPSMYRTSPFSLSLPSSRERESPLSEYSDAGPGSLSTLMTNSTVSEPSIRDSAPAPEEGNHLVEPPREQGQEPQQSSLVTDRNHPESLYSLVKRILTLSRSTISSLRLPSPSLSASSRVKGIVDIEAESIIDREMGEMNNTCR